MHRDLIREAEIAEWCSIDELPQLRGEMACVADPDACGDDNEEDEALPITLPSASTMTREQGTKR